MNIYGKIKNLLRRKPKHKEYLYLLSLPVMPFEDREHRETQYLRKDVITKIKNHLLVHHKKEITYSDVIIDAKEMLTYLLFASISPHTNPFITPLIYEIYAFKEKKTIEVFSYPVETLLFKINNQEINVLKLTIEY